MDQDVGIRLKNLREHHGAGHGRALVQRVNALPCAAASGVVCMVG